MNQPLFENVCFIGFGLIGASLAKVMRAKNLAGHIHACTRPNATTLSQTLIKAKDYGLIDAGFARAADAASFARASNGKQGEDEGENSQTGADLIVLAMPVCATQDALAAIADVITPNTIITDVGSTKGNVLAAAQAVFGEHLPAGFVPAHPIAGSEKSGVDAADVRLFISRKVILTPLETTSNDALQKVTKLWQAAGSEVIVMDVTRHDDVLARTSHLPHLLAYNLVDQLASANDNLEYFRYAAGGFRDFTRIAASDPTMWHDIAIANKQAILSAIGDFKTHLQQLENAIASGDSESMLGIFTRAQAARQHFDHMLGKTAYMNDANTDPNMNNGQPMSNTQTFTISPSRTFHGDISVPGDKSVSHRSIMFGALATGTTHITGFLEGEDALATLQAFRDMGVVIEGPKDGKVTVHGVGLHGLKQPPNVLYMGNSGTSMRLLSGILSAQAFDSVMTGDASLSKRPMERVAKPLREMGASIQTTGEKGTPPVSIKGNQNLKGVHYDMPVASAQVKSCLLLAGLWANGTTSVTEPEITRDHTERMLKAFGYEVQVQRGVGDNPNASKISVQGGKSGGGKLTAADIAVPSDISSAAFFMVAAAIAPDADILLKAVGINPTRTGVIDILKLMGADLTLENERVVGGEPVADIRVKSSDLQGIDIPEHLVPLAIDEFPALFVAASCATGKTVLTGAKELRVKESDRIQVMADGLQTLGIDCTPTDDGMVIVGKGDAEKSAVFGGGQIQSHHDHRIAMSFAVAGLRANDDIIIEGTETVATSFPNFVELAAKAGLKIATTSIAPTNIAAANIATKN